ncbi:hypothetical protein KC336_g17105, partial [Hortaea werneckii]
LARMHTLEEGFREVLREIKDLSSQKATGSSGSRGVGGGGGGSEGEVTGGAGSGYPAPAPSSSNVMKSHARPSLQQGMPSTSTSRISDVLEPRTSVRSRLGAGAATTTKDVIGGNPKAKKSPRKHHLQQARRAAPPAAAAAAAAGASTAPTSLRNDKGKEPAQEDEKEKIPAPTTTTAHYSSYNQAEENEVPSPESVIGPSVVEDARDGAAAERPGTAIHSPAALDSSKRVGEE